MNNISIVKRALTAQEMEHINTGFDKLSLEHGIALESTVPISLVALHEDRLMGCATGLAYKNGAQFSGWFHLTDLFIDKAFRNQGIGAKLLKELEQTTKTVGVNTIWLWTSGAASIRFYNRYGYTQFATMDHWYSDGSSRIGLRKTIA